MADKSISEKSGLEFDPDRVAVWLTHPLLVAYRDRGVFDECRPGRGRQTNSACSEQFHLTRERAHEMLQDASRMWAQSSHSMRNVYGNMRKRLEDSIQRAGVRRAQIEALHPVCLHKIREQEEEWRGTKQQLSAIGITLAGPYPGESGGARRRSMTRDSRGFKVWVKSAEDVWPGLFYAQVILPEKEAEERKWRAGCAEQRRSDAAKAATVTRLHQARSDAAFAGFMRSIGIGERHG